MPECPCSRVMQCDRRYVPDIELSKYNNTIQSDVSGTDIKLYRERKERKDVIRKTERILRMSQIYCGY